VGATSREQVGHSSVLFDLRVKSALKNIKFLQLYHQATEIQAFIKDLLRYLNYLGIQLRPSPFLFLSRVEPLSRQFSTKIQ